MTLIFSSHKDKQLSKDYNMKAIIAAETYDQRLERMTSYFDRLPNFVSRGKYQNKDKRNNVQAIRSRPEGNHIIKEWFFGPNIVTNDGDIFYAKKGAGETPATNENFAAGRFELRTGSATPAKANTYSAVTTPVTASRKVYDATYPKTNDTGDTDNTGDAVNAASYRVSWLTTDFNATGIIGGCIHDNASPVSGTKLLTHWSITSFDKTASDTLKMFVNHTLAGV